MRKGWAAVPLLLLAGTALPGCVAVAIPAIAGSAMVGSRVVDKEGADEPQAVAAAPATAQPAPTPAPASTPKPAAAPVLPPKPTPVPPLALASAPAPAPKPVAMPAAAPPPVATTVPANVPARPAMPDVTYPDPDRPIAAEQTNFVRFVRYGYASARAAAKGEELPSALLADPVALDGKRRRCAKGEQLIAMIDLDPAGGPFTPPASPAAVPGLALGLAVLREAGIEVAWISDLPTEQSGLVRAALEKSGLDPRGEDIISLRRDESDSKDQRRGSLAGVSCIIAIAGDERPDFDERFKYLRSPEAGAGIEPVVGDGWFLIEPLIGK